MPELNLPQAEADMLVAMEKHRIDDKEWLFEPDQRQAIPLTSTDKRENFTLDMTRYRIKITKATYQNRARQVVILMRLDIDGPPHRNPDGEEIPCPHLHVYREGYGDKWAMSAPANLRPDSGDLYTTFQAFMRHCNITEPPFFKLGLF